MTKIELKSQSLLAARHGRAATLTIDLGAVSENLSGLRNHLRAFNNSEPSVIAVVKASAYGTSGPVLARHLVEEGVEILAVTCTEEGVELRQAGIESRIIVLNPAPPTFSLLCATRLEPELYSLGHLAAFVAALSVSNGGEASSKRWPVHLKLDTGMHRLGFSETDLPKLLNALRAAESQVVIETLFSHLAAADDPQADEGTLRQIRRFESMTAELQRALPPGAHPLRVHLLNTAGVSRFPAAAGDYVRVGIGLFGIAPGPDMTLPWDARQVAHFQTKLLHVRNVPAGEGVGYGFSDASTTDRRIAILPVGYADGYPRCLSNGKGRVGIRGELAPVVGWVCMDLTLVDVTNIPEAAAGDCATLFGVLPSIEAVAAAADTIPYELLCRIPHRVERVFSPEKPID